MELGAIFLLLLSAGIHSVWNLLSKRSLNNQAFLWLALLVVGAALWPVLFFYPAVTPAGWTFILLSGALEAAYFLLLGGAYQRGDLSLVYPLVRGSAPLFVTLFAAIFLGERVLGGGIAGILLVVAGIYVVHLKSFGWRGLLAPILSVRERASQLALLTGLATSASVVVDKVGVSYTAPLLYLYLTFVVAALVMAPYMLLARRPAAAREWRVNKGSVVAVGLMFTGSYTLVLLALVTSKASYVSPVREISVVFGAALGAWVLRESFAATKVAGSLLIFAGVVLIALAR